ncbi:MAG: hypothetical protein J6D03_00160 [Clostridia bacterium]|nr:hypothetical protein [Clostridia bacterium]
MYLPREEKYFDKKVVENIKRLADIPISKMTHEDVKGFETLYGFNEFDDFTQDEVLFCRLIASPYTLHMLNLVRFFTNMAKCEISYRLNTTIDIYINCVKGFDLIPHLLIKYSYNEVVEYFMRKYKMVEH